MFVLDFLSWFFYAADEDGTLPILFGALVEATLAVVVSVTIYKLTDVRDLARRLDRIEDAHNHNSLEQDKLAHRVADIEDSLEDSE